MEDVGPSLSGKQTSVFAKRIGLLIGLALTALSLVLALWFFFLPMAKHESGSLDGKVPVKSFNF